MKTNKPTNPSTQHRLNSKAVPVNFHATSTTVIHHGAIMTFDDLLAMAAKGELKSQTYRATQAPDVASSMAAEAVAEADARLDVTFEDALDEAQIRGILTPALTNGRDPLCLILEAEEKGHFSFHDFIIGA